VTAEERRRWQDADARARPVRLERLRERMADEGVDAYFGARSENARYLTGFALADGEEKVAGLSGRFLVSADEVVVLADSRYRIRALEECPDARIEDAHGELALRWPDLLASLRPAGGGEQVRRVAVEAAFVSHADWLALARVMPDVELVPVEGWVEGLRAVKERHEVERIAAACRIADAALEGVLDLVRPGVTERELALALEWRMRTQGADGLAFDGACLSGPRAALPHGSPGERAIAPGEVLLFDFGARVAGYRSDMTRTIFVGDPSPRDRAIWELVSESQLAAIEALESAAAAGRIPTTREVDAVARDPIEAAGHGSHFGHGLGHGIGLATHEQPSIGRVAPDRPLPAPSVFSVEPGIYLDGETGVRIEDLVLFDPASGRLERLTGFRRELLVVAG
jgi:Xaa-Pro aminopeptidase